MARRDVVQSLLFAAAIVCAAATTAAAGGGEQELGPPNLVEACTKAVKADQLVKFCAQVFLKDKAGELTDTNDWRKMTRVVMSQGAANAAAIKERMAEMANNQSLSALERATLNLCLQNLKTGAEQIAAASAAFQKLDKISEDEFNEVEILLDDGKTSQGNCEDMLDSQIGMEHVWQEVHDAFLATRIVTRFFTHVRPDN